MKDNRHPLFERHNCMHPVERNTMKEGFGVDTANYNRVYRAIHIYGYLVIFAGGVEKQRYIKTVGAFGELAVFLIEGLYDFACYHLMSEVKSSKCCILKKPFNL